MNITDMEHDILRITNGEDVPGWCWGAAMSECLSSLKGKGLVRCVAGRYLPTEKGLELLEHLQDIRGEIGHYGV